MVKRGLLSVSWMGRFLSFEMFKRFYEGKKCTEKIVSASVASYRREWPSSGGRVWAHAMEWVCRDMEENERTYDLIAKKNRRRARRMRRCRRHKQQDLKKNTRKRSVVRWCVDGENCPIDDEGLRFYYSSQGSTGRDGEGMSVHTLEKTKHKIQLCTPSSFTLTLRLSTHNIHRKMWISFRYFFSFPFISTTHPWYLSSYIRFFFSSPVSSCARYLVLIFLSFSFEQHTFSVLWMRRWLKKEANIRFEDFSVSKKRTNVDDELDNGESRRAKRKAEWEMWVEIREDGEHNNNNEANNDVDVDENREIKRIMGVECDVFILYAGESKASLLCVRTQHSEAYIWGGGNGWVGGQWQCRGCVE